MTDNVVKGPFKEKEKTAGQTVLDAASGMGLQDAIVIGWTSDEELYFATTTNDVPEILYLLRKTEFEVLKADDGE